MRERRQIQATAPNFSGGTLLSQQTLVNWTSADACPPATTSNAAATRLIYVGQKTASFGNQLRLAALLSDGTGGPLAGRTVSFSFNNHTLTATTDGNGMATLPALALPVGTTSLAVSFAGDPSFQPANLSTSVAIAPAATLLRYTGSNLSASLGQQTVTALLTDFQGKIPVAGRSVAFTLNGVTSSGVTNQNGVATATLNFQTAQAAGPAQLAISFGGDAGYTASTRNASIVQGLCRHHGALGEPAVSSKRHAFELNGFLLEHQTRE